jgi:hypothetical protein
MQNDEKPVQPEPSVLLHIYEQLKRLEYKTGCVTVLQFATHPNGGMAMILRAYHPAMQKEYPYVDEIALEEITNNPLSISRIDVLFDTIYEALGKLQIVKPGDAAKAGITH